MSVEAMKQAIEALEVLARYENPETRVQVRKPRDGGPIVTMYPHKVATDAAGALRAAIEQTDEQEPVAWMYEWDGKKHLTFTDQRFVEQAHPHFNKSTPLYTIPSKRPWVGLTDEDYETLSQYAFVEVIEKIEAVLKEKNT